MGCHSQMVRPFRDETERYGEYSKSGEFIYDRPFLWGSKRTGPDLHRIGGKYPDLWHYKHMVDPRETSPGSMMPAYPWMAADKLNTAYTAKKISSLEFIGTPYDFKDEDEILKNMQDQAAGIAESLRNDGVVDDDLEKREIVALIAYLQRLGTDIKPKPEVSR